MALDQTDSSMIAGEEAASIAELRHLRAVLLGVDRDRELNAALARVEDALIDALNHRRRAVMS